MHQDLLYQLLFVPQEAEDVTCMRNCKKSATIIRSLDDKPLYGTLWGIWWASAFFCLSHAGRALHVCLRLVRTFLSVLHFVCVAASWAMLLYNERHTVRK